MSVFKIKKKSGTVHIGELLINPLDPLWFKKKIDLWQAKLSESNIE